MLGNTLVREKMTTNLFTVYTDTSLDQTLNIMLLNDVSRIPVLDREGHIVGMLTDRDMKLVLDSPFLELTPQQSTESLRVRNASEVMNTPVFAISETSTILDAVRVMRHHKVGGLPVMDEERRLVGLLTRTDILDLFIEEHSPVEEQEYILLTHRK